MRPHRPRRTVRLRLTLLYGVLFLVAGAVLLAITYGLVERATGNTLTFSGPNGSAGAYDANGDGASANSEPSPTGAFQVGPSVGDLTPAQLSEQADTFARLAREQHAAQMHQLLVQSAFALAGMAVVSIALGWLVAGRVLRPLRTITAAARDISATNLHARLALEGPHDELRELGDTFDGLLDRLEAAFVSQRLFVANASRELRTPLARQKTLIQVALADPEVNTESLRYAHQRVLAAGEQQERLIDALLALARSHAGLERRERCDLDAIAALALALALDDDDAARHAVDLQRALGPARFRGDARLIEQLVVNLVDNALRYNVPGGYVRVTTDTRDNRAILAVSNSGPVVPNDAVDRLFRPFQRLGPERTGHSGAGLGLSIVRAVADAHGATITTDPRRDGGLEIEVAFPIATERSTAEEQTRAPNHTIPWPIDATTATTMKQQRGASA
jgi:signal transduction histidine kinase